MAYNILTIYTHYKRLTKKQRQYLLATLQSQGINVMKIEAYEYSDAPDIKHMFFYFSDSQEPIPYFMLDEKVWEQIQTLIMQTT